MRSPCVLMHFRMRNKKFCLNRHQSIRCLVLGLQFLRIDRMARPVGIARSSSVRMFWFDVLNGFRGDVADDHGILASCIRKKSSSTKCSFRLRFSLSAAGSSSRSYTQNTFSNIQLSDVLIFGVFTSFSFIIGSRRMYNLSRPLFEKTYGSFLS